VLPAAVSPVIRDYNDLRDIHLRAGLVRFR
jgi:hypothetical protein